METLVRLWFVVSDLGLWETIRPELGLPEIDIAEYESPRGVIRKGVCKASVRWLAAASLSVKSP